MTLTEIRLVRERLLSDLDAANTPDTLNEFKLANLTRKGTIAAMFDRLREVSREEKPLAGKELNDLRQTVEARFAEREAAFGGASSKRGPHTAIDLTMPARPVTVSGPGHEHPLVKTMNEMISIFERMGFAIESGPEIEDEEHNFGKLNFPPDHPARDMQDTFFVKPYPGGQRSANSDQPTSRSDQDLLVLRTHTSPVQIRVMESQPPPIRAIMPGRVYRNEAISARSGVAFFQLEGLVVDRGVSMADLKGVLLSFAKQFFGSDAKIRLRPSFFPFTEPSAEVDVSCYICGGKGCRVCKNSGWLEILGAGMVHPNVLRNCGIDPEVYTGYAFGMGIDRTAMMRYGVTDIRDFFENDYRFIEQL
jgi:phenylalanyl-tRNA synthetase alpha chain